MDNLTYPKKTVTFSNTNQYISPQSEHIKVIGDDKLNIYLCAVFIAFLIALIAKQQNELNTPLFIFMVFFPYAYFLYIIVGWLID